MSSSPRPRSVSPLTPAQSRSISAPSLLLVDPSPLTRTEQAAIKTTYSHCKHYYMLMENIKCTCFTALDASINDAFKVSDNPAIQGWHTEMRIIDILDQLSSIYGQPTPAVMEQNDIAFCSPYLAVDAPEVLFRRIKDCTEIALLGQNPYADHQLISNAICLLLTTGLYLWLFKEWDCFENSNCIRSICTKTNTNSSHTNWIHSILRKNQMILRKIGHVIQLVVHQFVCKTSAKKILTSEKNWSPNIPRYTGIRRISTKEKKMVPYKPYVRGKHVESILGTHENMNKKGVQFE
jgi:hypothetical protein